VSISSISVLEAKAILEDGVDIMKWDKKKIPNTSELTMKSNTIGDIR
jgi:hypothetical protein